MRGFSRRGAAAAALGAAALLVGVLIATGVLGRHRRSPVTVSATGSSVVVETARPSRVYLEYGPGRDYGLFTIASTLGLSHRFVLRGLDPGGLYHVRAIARASGRTLLGPDITVRVAAGPASHSLRIVGDHLELDGRAWIPRFTWGSCASDYAREASLGINAFMSSNCGDSPQRQARAALQAGGLLIPALDQARLSLPTTVATYLADEPDLLPVPPSQLAAKWQAFPNAHGVPTFLTLSPRAASPPPQLEPDYTAYARLADVLGIDVYPISNGGDPAAVVQVATAQQTLRRLAEGKPTFQWIEATRPSGDPGSTPTAVEIEAEAWLAIVNGARALGWWTDATTPFSVSAPNQVAIRQVDTALDTLAPAIDAPVAPVTLDNSGVDVFATAHDGSLAVFAVSTDPTGTVQETFNLPGLGGRSVQVWNTGRTLHASRDTFTDTLPPLAWRVYLIAPLS